MIAHLTAWISSRRGRPVRAVHGTGSGQSCGRRSPAAWAVVAGSVGAAIVVAVAAEVAALREDAEKRRPAENTEYVSHAEPYPLFPWPRGAFWLAAIACALAPGATSSSPGTGAARTPRPPRHEDQSPAEAPEGPRLRSGQGPEEARAARNGVGRGRRLGWLAYAYLTLPDVRPLADTNPQTTAFVELRAREAHASGKKTPRRVQRWVPSSPDLAELEARGARRRGCGVLGTRGRGLLRAAGVDRARLDARPDARREHRPQQLAKNLYCRRRATRSEVPRADPRAPPRSRARQGAHLRDVPERDRIGRRHWGAEAAARTYYGVPSAALGPSQAALLAGAIINPRLLNPAEPTARLLRRQRIILKRMGGVTPPEPARPLAPPPEPSEPLPGQPVTPDELPRRCRPTTRGARAEQKQ